MSIKKKALKEIASRLIKKLNIDYKNLSQKEKRIVFSKCYNALRISKGGN